MNRKIVLLCLALVAVFVWTMPIPAVFAAEPIVIGVPTSLGFLEGKEAHKVVQMAVSEINAKGGVNVGGTKRPLIVVAADLRDAGYSAEVDVGYGSEEIRRRRWVATVSSAEILLSDQRASTTVCATNSSEILRHLERDK